MDKALLLILLILLVLLFMTPAILWINNRFNNYPEDVDDLSDGNLIILDIKRELLNKLDQWIKEHDLNHEQVANELSTNLKVVSDIVHQRFDKFTVDRLVALVLRTGNSVKLIVKNE